jgi:hypothetical protein
VFASTEWSSRTTSERSERFPSAESVKVVSFHDPGAGRETKAPAWCRPR